MQTWWTMFVVIIQSFWRWISSV